MPYRKKNKDLSDVDAIAEGMERDKKAAEAEPPVPPATEEAPPPKARKADIQVHHTQPIDKSLARLKKASKPRKNKQGKTEVPENGESQSHARKRNGRKPEGVDPAHAGKRGGFGFRLPIDFFSGD